MYALNFDKTDNIYTLTEFRYRSNEIESQRYFKADWFSIKIENGYAHLYVLDGLMEVIGEYEYLSNESNVPFPKKSFRGRPMKY